MKYLSVFRACFFGLLFLLSYQIFGQAYHFTEYNLKDGLLSAHISDVLEDQVGFIWIATEGGGLCRYDGIDFQNFIPEQVGLPPYLHSLTIDGEGSIWIGGDGGIVRYDNGSFTPFLFKNSKIRVNDLFVMDSTVIVTSNRGIHTFSVKKGRFAEPIFAEKESYQILQERGHLYIGSEDGIIVRTESGWNFQGLDKGLLSGKYKSITADVDGKIWVASDRSGIYTGDETKWTPFADNRNLSSRNITFLNHGEIGTMYVGTTDKGLLVWQAIDSRWQTIGLREGLAYPDISCMIFDRWGNAWVGSAGGGLFKYTAQEMIFYNERLGLAGESIQYLKSGADGKIYIIYENGIIETFDQNHAKPVTIPPEIEEPLSCWSGRGQELSWFGSTNGLIFLQNGRKHLWKEDPTALKNRINDLHVLNDSSALVCTDRAVYIIHISSQENHDGLEFTAVDLMDAGAKRFFQDKQGRLWYYGRNTVGYLENDSLHNIFSKFQDLSVNVVSMAEGRDGTIYMGSRDQGLFYASGSYIYPVQNQEVITSPYLRAISMDQEFNLWIATVEGITKASLESNSLIAVYSHPKGAYSAREIGLGLGIRDDFGNILFGTNQGLIRIPPQYESKTHLPPNLFLEEISTGNHLYDISKSGYDIRIPFRENHIEIKVKAIDHRYPQDLTYTWRMPQTGDQWQPCMEKGKQVFYNLSPGFYVYEVKAENRMGGTSSIIQIPFKILRPWWGSIPMQITYLLLACTMLVLIYRRRISHLIKKKNEETEKLVLENKLLMLQQQASRLQMNPHFIFNVLQSIESKIMLGNKSEARKSLQDFSLLMRSMLDQSRMEKISLEDEISILNKYLNVEREIRKNAFDYHWQIEEDMDPSLIHIPTMIVQPFLENAIKHGQPKVGKGQILISIEARKSYLMIKIQDNGPGFNRTARNRNHRAVGIDVTTKRLRSYFKDTEPVKIENLINEGKILGTSVTLKIPMIDD